VDRVSNQDLLNAGLYLMQVAGKTLTKIPTATRAMKYALPDGQSVRIRTCNDPVLVVLAESAEQDARLNIEGTDHLLIVMPARPRTPGPVNAYLVPTNVAVAAVRQAHAAWLASSPSTSGNNRTWNIWFDEDASPWRGFAMKWQQHRLNGHVTTESPAPTQLSTSRSVLHAVTGKIRETRPLGAIIAEARKMIAAAAGVSIEDVKISVNLG
jgi:hypothetical protein